MATSQISMIPQFEEICREAMRVDKLGDNLDGTIRGDVSEATIDVCCNDDVVTLIRKALPDIENLVVMKATDEEDGWHAALLEDAIGTLISNFLIAAARIYPAQRETCRDDASHMHVFRNLNVLPPSSAKLLLWNPNGKATPFDPTHQASTPPPNDAA
jgi:hypothetical protein